MDATDSALIDRFLEMMAAERGAARNTLAAYRRDLDQASALATGRLAAATPATLRKIMADYASLAASSAARKLSALRQFFAFLLDEGERGDNPALDIARPATRRPLPRILTHDDIEKLFAQAGREAEGEAPPASAVRQLLFLELLYGSGLRASELVSLPRRAIAGERAFLIVRGKGDKERLVPLSDRSRTALDRWLPLLADGSAWLFPSGKAHVSRVRLFQMLRELAGRAGSDPQAVSPHVLRHAFATHLINHGADLRVVQLLLGHAEISTTQIYPLDARERLKQLHAMHHPRG
jgi:integrase/recombinase XerD